MLVAVLVAGCGAGSTHQKPSLHASAEKRLLTLVAHARAAASERDGTAVHAVMGEFVSEVRTLRTSGQLTGSTAANLEREAHSTAVQAAAQLRGARLRPAKPAHPKPTVATQTTPVAATTTQDTPATPAARATTSANPTPTPPPAATTPSATHSTPRQNAQGDGDGSDSPWPGHHHRGSGHRNGNASGWWGALHNWIDSASHGGGND